MLEVRHVSKQFSGSLAVNDVSFRARAGEVTGYLGPNGSGKSTTIKIIAGLIEPTAGEILFGGEPVRRDLIAWKQRLGYVPEEPHLYVHLSGLDPVSGNIEHSGAVGGYTAEALFNRKTIWRSSCSATAGRVWAPKSRGSLITFEHVSPGSPRSLWTTLSSLRPVAFDPGSSSCSHTGSR